MAAALWHALMLVWLGLLLLGAWQALPLLRNGETPPQDLVAAAVWLVIGAAAWALALNLGRQRYWRRRR